jgi:hypothetical protein
MLLGALILALAFLPTLDQPSPRQAVHDDPATAQMVIFIGMSIEGGESWIESGTVGGLMGAAAAAFGEIAGLFGWFGAATVSAIGGAAVITMGAAA